MPAADDRSAAFLEKVHTDILFDQKGISDRGEPVQIELLATRSF